LITCWLAVFTTVKFDSQRYIDVVGRSLLQHQTISCSPGGLWPVKECLKPGGSHLISCLRLFRGVCGFSVIAVLFRDSRGLSQCLGSLHLGAEGSFSVTLSS
jgi:hypothetical protein